MNSDKLLEPRISVVIPVYRSASWLKDLTREISSVLTGLSLGYEIILVDDCSPDSSWQVIKEISLSNPAVRGFQLMHNEGQVRATLCGLQHSKGAVVITMDDDFQHRPDQLLLLIKTLESNPDMDCVLGVFDQKRHSFYR
ncbi:MAG: glycosyltransferase, partial [Desulfonatronovibrionaceae bacterium]